ncbi:MAG: MFS transporter [Gemmatimonadota bacterium]
MSELVPPSLRPAGELSHASDNAVYRKVGRRLIPILFFCYIVAYLDRVNVGFAKLQMATDLGFSDTVYGLGAGIFFIGYFVFEVPSNLILQRVGARRWIARIMIMWGILSAATMFVRSETSFYVMRSLLGAAEAGFFPGVILYLTYWFPRARRARMTAAFMTAVAVAGVVGGPVSGWILARLGGEFGLHGWQWLFLLEGLPSAIGGIVVFLYLTDDPAEAHWLSPPEKALLLSRLAEDDQARKAGGEPNETLMDAFRHPKVWMLCVVYFGLAMALYGISFWLPQIIKDSITTDPVAIGLISAIPWAVAAAAMVLNGIHSDVTGERRWHVTLPAVAGGLGLAVSAIPGIGGWGGVAALTIATSGALSALSCFWSLPTAILSGTAAAAGLAWINSVGNLAGYVSPFAVGKIRDATHTMLPALIMLSLSLGVSAVLTLLLNKVGRSSPGERPAGP